MGHRGRGAGGRAWVAVLLLGACAPGQEGVGGAAPARPPAFPPMSPPPPSLGAATGPLVPLPPDVLRVSGVGRCDVPGTPEGALCRLPERGGFGLCTRGACAPSARPLQLPPAWTEELPCASTAELHGATSDGQALLASCTDNPFDRSRETWVGPNGEGRLYRFTPSSPPSAVERYHRDGFQVTLTARPDWVLGTTQAGAALAPIGYAVDVGGTRPEAVLDPSARLAEARLQASPAAPASAPHWVQGLPDRLVGAVALEGARVFLAVLHLPEGTVEATRLLDGEPLGPPIADEGGNLFLALQRPSGVQTVRLDARLAPTHTRNEGALPVAVYDGTLVLASGSVLDADTLRERYRLPGPFTQVFLGPACVTLLHQRGLEETHVLLLAREDGTPVAEESVPFQSALPPLLTEEGTLLLVRQELQLPPPGLPQRATSWLHEVGRGGGALPVLHLAEAGRWRSLTLLGGTLVAMELGSGGGGARPRRTLLGFPLPGVRAPRHGWLGVRGGSRGMGAPE